MPPIAFWLFGRSAAGKTTLANLLSAEIRRAGRPVVELDGDQLRAGLSRDLGFSAEARTENHRRLAELARLISDQEAVVVVSSMAPLAMHRKLAADILGTRVRWVHVDATLETCIRRDPKQLYHRARTGSVSQLLEFPFDAPAPDEPVLRLVTDLDSVEETARRLIDWARPQIDSAAGP